MFYTYEVYMNLFLRAADGRRACTRRNGRSCESDRGACVVHLQGSRHALWTDQSSSNGQNEGAAPVNTQVLDNDIEVVMPANFARGEACVPDAGLSPLRIERGRRADAVHANFSEPQTFLFPLSNAFRAVTRHPHCSDPQRGVLTGSIYALVALGLTLIYGVLHIINFAHGALLEHGAIRGVLRV